MKTDWEFDNLAQMLEMARNGDTSQIESLTKDNPFAKANTDFTKLLVLRKFRAKKMPFMPHALVSIAEPNDENFQWGITICTTPEDGETEYSVYIPNKYNYTGLSFENDEVFILADDFTFITNIRELHKKLREFHPMFDQADLERAFETLGNEQFNAQNVSVPMVIEPIIENAILGTLTYDEKYTQYENYGTSKYFPFELSIYNEEPEQFAELLTYVEAQMKAAFYKQALLDMEKEMILLKNDSWLDEGEEKITTEQFRKLVFIENMVFFSDKSCSIYCNDGELFGEHLIEISIDEHGKYDGASLAG